MFAQSLQGTVHTHPSGVFAEAQLGSDFGVGALLKVAQQQGVSVRFGQLVHGLVEHRCQTVPIGFGIGGAMGFLHGVRLVFATSTAGFVPDVSGSHAMGRRVQPAHQRRMPRESVRLAGEFGEDRLGDVCRSCRVATDLPNGGRVD